MIVTILAQSRQNRFGSGSAWCRRKGRKLDSNNARGSSQIVMFRPWVALTSQRRFSTACRSRQERASGRWVRLLVLAPIDRIKSCKRISFQNKLIVLFNILTRLLIHVLKKNCLLPPCDNMLKCSNELTCKWLAT